MDESRTTIQSGQSAGTDPRNSQPDKASQAALKLCDRASLVELLQRKMPPNDWIIDGLIHSGDQVVLAGPPKIGKSILGFQLALAVAEGATSFLSENFKTQSRPRKVLVFSLEMNEPMVGERLRKIFPPDKPDSLAKAAEIKLDFVFRVRDLSSLDVVDFDRSSESKAKKAGTASISQDGWDLQEIINEVKPDLVVFDTLIRVHALDENNNVAMSHLLKYLRDICSIKLEDREPQPESQSSSWEVRMHRKRLAHVLIHHTRKESNIGNGSANRDANAVRGAGAIHSEADLVLTLSEWDRNGVVMMSMSARRVEVPDELFLKRQDLEFRIINRPIGTRETKAKALADALWDTFQSVLPADDGLGLHQIVERVAERGYTDLTEENFRKTYVRKIMRFLNVKEPKKGDEDRMNRYRLRETARQEDFYAALKTKTNLNV